MSDLVKNPVKGHRLEGLAWTEVRPLLTEGRVAVLPIGSAAKEHGPHLPMSSDWRQAEALGALLAERAPVLVWPTLGYGFYPAFVDYPGSTSVDAATFEATVRQLLGDLARAGAPALLVLNTGISTIPSVEAAVASAAIPARASHVYRGARYVATRDALLEQAAGGHADEAETSILLHLDPTSVHVDRARPWTTPIGPGRWSPDDPRSPRYSPDGVFGDPTRASADKGQRLVEAMLEDLGDAVAALLDGE